nr:putative serine/threonine-protein kinase isoform X1 [Ipomoea trifida]
MISRMESSVAAVAGGVGGALVLLGVILLVCFCMFHYKRYSNRNSDTASSDPSAVVEQKREGGSSGSSQSTTPRLFRMKELEHATRHFDEANLIGYGSFGLVFKGLLYDGTIVAIKRRSGSPRPEFSDEVAHLQIVQHRNVVNVLGYCQENGYQMLVFEYLPNGSVCSHLYGRDSTTKLEFKQRLSIATGAAKGLCHLHAQRPPVIHGNFNTANVLVDENFIAKVADAGVSRLLEKIDDDAGPSESSSSRASVFRDPEVDRNGEGSDVYSFGVFLWELITGREASHIDGFGSNESMLHWVEVHLNEEDLVDDRLKGGFTAEGMGDFIRLALRCTGFPRKDRPAMEAAVAELERILDKEIMRTTVMGGEGTATVTLGSQLFTK